MSNQKAQLSESQRQVIQFLIDGGTLTTFRKEASPWAKDSAGKGQGFPRITTINVLSKRGFITYDQIKTDDGLYWGGQWVLTPAGIAALGGEK